MKNILIVLLLFASFKTSLCQTILAPVNEVIKLTDSAKTANVKRDADIMMKATVANNFAVLTKYTHPIVVQMMGGAANMTAYLSKEIKSMQAQGVTFSDARVGAPEQLIAVGNEYYCVLPQKVVMAYRSKRIYNTSSLLAVSANGGLTWRFVDAGAMTDEQIKQYFPKIYGKLTIPKRSEAKELIE